MNTHYFKTVQLTIQSTVLITSFVASPVIDPRKPAAAFTRSCKWIIQMIEGGKKTKQKSAVKLWPRKRHLLLHTYHLKPPLLELSAQTLSSSVLQSCISAEEVLDWDCQEKDGYPPGGFSIRTNSFNFTTPILILLDFSALMPPSRNAPQKYCPSTQQFCRA